MIPAQTYVLFGAVWCCWCGLHSYLISSRVVGWLEKRLGPASRFYRLAYNLFSTLSLAVPVLFSFSLRHYETAFFVWDGWLQFVRSAFLLLSFLLFWAGSRNYRLSHFLGVEQIRTGEKSLLLSDAGRFNRRGVSGIVRHPWYLGGIVLVWSAFKTMYPSTLISAVILTGYFVIGAMLEERKLLAHYGNAYRAYQQQVSMLLPVKWLSGFLDKLVK